jgi:hypothetical protein
MEQRWRGHFQLSNFMWKIFEIKARERFLRLYESRQRNITKLNEVKYASKSATDIFSLWE